MSFRYTFLITSILCVSILANAQYIDAGNAINFLTIIAVSYAVLGAIKSIKYDWIFTFYRWVNYPLRKHYESREKNYKDVISTLEKQLFEQKRKDAINEYHHSKANVNNFKNEEHKNRTHVNEL